jgi:beta-lactamase class A
VDASPPLPPPAIEQPASYQVSYGLVTGRAAPGTKVVVVSANGRVLAARRLRGRRFWLRVTLPTGDVSVRVSTLATAGRRSSRVVRNVFGLPATARPRAARSRNDVRLARQLRALAAGHRGATGIYVQSLTSGAGAAWNAKARFPAASTLKLGIATAVLAEHSGIPPPGSRLDGLLREMIVPSDDAAANELLVWLAGSTSAGGQQVNALMRSIGLVDSIMYGGYLVRSLSSRIPVRVEQQPAFGVGKYTTARDMTSLWRALWQATENRGVLRRARPGLTRADARYLLWLTAHVRDQPKLDRRVSKGGDVAVLHKAGWISTARHDTGLVFWRGGVFVAGVMTWNGNGAGRSSDVLAGRVAEIALARFRDLARRGG